MDTETLEKLKNYGIKSDKEALSITKLDLRQRGLTELGPEIGCLKKLMTLLLDDNQLAALPVELGNLANLQVLSLKNNYITTLPVELGNLANLRELVLSENRLTALPVEIGKLANLELLGLRNNQFTAFPVEIYKLTSLGRLNLHGNQLTSLPIEINKLTNLHMLLLGSNHLTALPVEIGKLTKLEKLSLSDNHLTALPVEIGKLTKLVQKLFYTSGNPITKPPPEIVEQGIEALRLYWNEDRLPSWASKVLVVGEGGAGKTSMLKRLGGGAFDNHESTTHGIRVGCLRTAHPELDGVTMELNTWDFGGQDIYHATHQFFLTNRSLFLLVWNARLGHTQGRLFYWLDMIQARAPKSPVIIVATHTDERPESLPFTDIQRTYPNVVAHIAISNASGDGLDALQELIRTHAARLPLMGEEWPVTWHDAATKLRARPEKQMTPAKLEQIMKESGVSEYGVPVLRRWMHELGDLLYYEDNKDLDDVVILKPQWASEYVSKVLDSAEVKAEGALLTQSHMMDLWSDLDARTQSHFLRLMEQFDLSYRTLTDTTVSLVVEQLSEDEADYRNLWDTPLGAPGCHRLAAHYSLSSLPAGIPTWFIARSHRFTTNTHWRYGAVFTHRPDAATLGLVLCSPTDRTIALETRGPFAHEFFAILRDGLELTLDRFPGLRITREIPCPGHDGEACDYRFNYVHLVSALERTPPTTEMQCAATGRMVSVSELLFGFDLRVQPQVLGKIEELKEEIKTEIRHTSAIHSSDLSAAMDGMKTEMRDLAALAQVQQLKLFQAQGNTLCPALFMLQPHKSERMMERIKSSGSTPIDLQLYCQEPGHWHPALVGGLYTISQPGPFLEAVGPHIRTLVKLLSVTTPFLGPILDLDGMKDIADEFKANLDLMKELTKDAKDLIGDGDDPGFGNLVRPDLSGLRQVQGADLRVLYELLDREDKAHRWGGLEAVITKEGHARWLCKDHAAVHKL